MWLSALGPSVHLFPHLCPWQLHMYRQTHNILHIWCSAETPRVVCVALAQRWDLVFCCCFNQMLAGWKSPLCVMEAEWWWLQTAACHLCSLVGRLRLWARRGTVTLVGSFSKQRKSSELCSEVFVIAVHALAVCVGCLRSTFRFICDILSQSDV